MEAIPSLRHSRGELSDLGDDNPMLTRELLRKIRKIEIVTQRLVRDRMAGQYHSVFKGSGIAFSEVRHYMPGDDIRLIDWNVSARMNDAYIKLFVEEREMTVLLL